ncbi:hypothetical protein SAMD00019534_113460 [Acytostelium subglobosum LB1]|uniref:hypothetical protein n=1 Tax=Acytostelium subglobosum LB1 TaxID=1410327 RepID=UPI000644EAA2|nr:hypothetical protein SAMD00019534_113460 [Acytostelium subglobosum LB1]GAM28170.1 hypothetical protein SAMD00019534_113460 [Acytostelium subglobosum LB1]|eukprot:XP_012748804.1 hypothetical protein SAMD00019534_113460 [Acytostelium subglobosum LB1]
MVCLCILAGLYAVYKSVSNFRCVWCMIKKGDMARILVPAVDPEGARPRVIPQRKPTGPARTNGGYNNDPLITCIPTSHMVPDLLHVLVAVVRTFVKHHFKWLETWLNIEVDGNRVGKRVKDMLLAVMARLGPKIPPNSMKPSESKPTSLVARWESTRVKFQAAIDIILRRNDMFNIEDLLIGETEVLRIKYHEYKVRALDTWHMLHHFFSTMIDPGTAPAIRTQNRPAAQATPTPADPTPAAPTPADPTPTPAAQSLPLFDRGVWYSHAYIFAKLSIEIYGPSIITSYVHCLCHHVPEAIYLFGSLDRLINMAPEGRHYANKLVLERNANGTIYGVAELCQVQLKRGNVITMVSYQTDQYQNLLNGTNSRNVTYKARMNVRNPSVFDKYRATHGMTTSSSDNSHHPCPSDNEEEYDEEYNDDMYEHGQAAHQSDDEDGGDETDDEPHYESYGGGGGMDNSDGEQTPTGTIEHAHVPMMEDVPQLQDTLMNTHYYNDGDKVYAMSIEVDVGTWWPGTVKSSDYDEHNEVMSYVVKFDQGTDSQLTVQENVCIATAYTQQDDSRIEGADVLVFIYDNGKTGRFYRGTVEKFKLQRRKRTFEVLMLPIGKDGVLDRLMDEYNNIQDRLCGLSRSGITLSNEAEAKYNNDLTELERQITKCRNRQTPRYRVGREDTRWIHWCDNMTNIFIIQ